MNSPHRYRIERNAACRLGAVGQYGPGRMTWLLVDSWTRRLVAHSDSVAALVRRAESLGAVVEVPL